jgi:uncharacterized OB-fold protein
VTEYGKPLPPVDDRSRPFWEGARKGELRLQRCFRCEAFRMPPSRYCPGCGSEGSTWARASGQGTVESFCLFHKAYFPGFESDLPYNVALVRLAEGARLFTNVVGVANDQLRIGMEVEACFDAITPEVTLVKFRPVGPGRRA